MHNLHSHRCGTNCTQTATQFHRAFLPAISLRSVWPDRQYCPRKANPSMAGLMVVRMQSWCNWTQVSQMGSVHQASATHNAYRWGYTGALDAAEARKGFAGQHSLSTLKSLRIDLTISSLCTEATLLLVGGKSKILAHY